MKKKMALFMALVMLAILPFDAVSAAGNGSGEAVIISEDADGAAETTASEDTESGESAEKVQGETDAQQETAAESETQALDITETESVAEADTEVATEAVTEAAAESEASQTGTAEAETSEDMTSQTESVEAETSEDMVSVKAEEEMETSDAAASQAESSEDDAQVAETEADDGILVASVEEVESTEEEAGIQTASTDTELSVNKTYSLADIISSTQYFSVSAAGRVRFIIRNTVNTSYTLYVYNTDLIYHNKVTMLAGQESATSYYVTLPEAKQYSFYIGGSVPNSEATLYIEYEAAGTYYGDTESNDSFDTANEIQLNKEYIGMVSDVYDLSDFYHFSLSSSSKVSFSFDFYDENRTEQKDWLELSLYSENSNGNTTLLFYESLWNTNTGTELYDLRLPAGSYFIEVDYETAYFNAYDYTPYKFTVNVSAETADAYEIEKNDLTSQANKKQTNTWYTGNINTFGKIYQNDDSSDIDWFSYSVSEKCYLTVELKTPRQSSGTVTAILYQLSGQELVEVATITSGSNPYISSEKIFSQAGSYYLKMTGSSADWDYSVCLTQEKYVALTGISLPSTASVVNGSTLSLSPTFKPSNASEQGLTWTSSNTDVATVDENGKITALSVGKTTITATSSFSDSSSVKAKCTVYVTRKVTLKLTSVENKATGIKLTWSKVSGASGYYVYRRTASGKFSKIKTITSGSTVTYTDKSIKSKNGKTYVYKVVPYSNYITGSGTGKKITRLTGTKLNNVKNAGSEKLTVKWKKASNVSGYQIQYSTSSSFSSGNKTKLVSGKAKKSCTLTGLTGGRTYYVRVRTYKTVSGKKSYSAWSSKKKIKVTSTTTDVTSKYKTKVLSLLQNFDGVFGWGYSTDFSLNNYTKSVMVACTDINQVEGKTLSYTKNVMASKMKLYFGGSSSTFQFRTGSSSMISAPNVSYLVVQYGGTLHFLGGNYGDMEPYGVVSKIIRSGSTYTVTYKMYYRVYGESGSTYTGTYKVTLKEASNTYGFIITGISYEN